VRRKLTILGVPHSLVISDKALEEYLEDTEYAVDDIRGLYDDYDRRIFVREGMNSYQTALTILHEWLHAVGSVTGQTTLAY